ncbi:MAG TPA: SDR family NAD(P)-dependent oxidoreductase, partial [Candidatus Thermoplasmatota archaeon]|nr:SDR family NAD(P)-dependent oxidoreductase [Candidatus Thermoplasmatota archaeon]
GARGITAEALKALLNATAVASGSSAQAPAVAPQRPTLILLGRTEVPQDADADLADADFARLKDEAKAQLAAKGERVTPVAIEKAVAPRKARAEVARTLRAMRQAGATVEYHAVDASDADALARLLADVRARHGRVTGVLHAAGVEESKRLADKDEGAFDRAWRPKAEAAFALARLTEKDDLRFFVMFGSVAGRYGNAAQADYSAANDALAKLARALRGRGVDAAVLCWGPWGETGMATRGSTLTVLKAAGVEPITTQEGVRAFLSELARLDEPEVVLAKGLGALEQGASVGAGREVRRTLVATDPAMDHHRVEGVPFLAGVQGLQLFHDAAEGSVRGFEDVHFAYPVKLLRDQPVEVTVKLDGTNLAQLTTIPPGPPGAAREPRVHFRAKVVTHDLPFPASRPIAHPQPWGFDRIYPPFFHGPAYQVLARADRVAADGVEVAGRAPAPGVSPMAATLEGALQALGLWGLAVGRVMALPERALRVVLAGPYDPARTTYRVSGAHVRDNRVWGEVECLVDGRPVAALQGVSLVVTGPSPLDDAPRVWRVANVPLGGADVAQVPVEDARALLARRELLGAWLSGAEQAALAALPVEKRREEWLAATLAAKTALRTAGDARAHAQIEVLRGSDGAPLAHGPHGLTLSHAGGVAVARVFDAATERVGVDVESVEPRSPAFEDEAFSPEERAGFPQGADRPAAVTLAWAAKEAILKALGTGLSLPLHAVRLRLADGRAEVELTGPAKERFSAIGGESLSVDARRDGALVHACARLRVRR